MLEFVKLFPLLSVSVFSVISISCFTIFLRRSIYFHLRDSARNIQRNRHSGIVDTLKQKFQKASNILENVNTTALIDSVYSEETFEFFGSKLHCEKWDEFCRILPNLLLYFGLLGTFLGITLNLSSLSDTISQTNDDNINSLITQIQEPLKGMGIAFITSLFGVFCSSILILCNLRWNTNFALNKLMSLLEDYLDNELHPSIDGYTRMDKAVNRMVEQQNEFLTRFHEKVGQVIESTMGKAADKMIAENAVSHQLAREVYQRLLESSGTFSNAVTTFQAASNVVKSQVQIIENQVKLVTTENQKFVQVSHSLQTTSNIFADSTNKFKNAAEKIEASKFSENLENLTFKLAETQANFSQSTKSLGEILPQFMAENVKATELADKIYQEFEKSAGVLQESAITFLESAETIKNSEFADQLSLTAASFAETQAKFSESTTVLNQSTQSLENGILNINNSVQKLTELSGKQLANLDKQSTQFRELHQNISTNLNDGIGKMVNLGEQQLRNLETQSIQFMESQKTNQNYLTNMAKQLQTETNNIVKLQETTEKMVNLGEKQLTNLETQSIQFMESQKTNQNYLNNITKQLQTETNNIVKLQETNEKMVKLGALQLSNLNKQSEEFVKLQESNNNSINLLSNNLNQEINKIVNLGEQQLTNLETQSTQFMESQKTNQNYLTNIAKQLQTETNNIAKLQETTEKMVNLGEQQLTNLDKHSKQISLIQTDIAANLHQSIEKITKLGEQQITNLDKHSNQILQIQKTENNYFNTICHNLQQELINMENLDNSLEKVVQLTSQQFKHLQQELPSLNNKLTKLIQLSNN